MRSVIYTCWVAMAFISFWGCEECEECERVATAPVTNLVFINNTLLEEVIDSIEVASASAQEADSLARLATQEISALQADTARFNQLIAEGQTGLEDSLAMATEALALADAERIELEQTLAVEAARVDSLSALGTTIENGEVLVSRITNLRNGLEVTNSDTLSSYLVPLEVEVDETNYELEIDGTTYDLTIMYEREQTLNVERVLRITASSLFATSSNFEDIIVQCPEDNPDCISGETVIGCFF